MTEEERLSSLAENLTNDDSSVRDDAVIRLLNAPQVAPKVLLEALSRDGTNHALVATLLAHLRHTPAIYPLRLRLARTDDPETRASVERAVRYLEGVAIQDKSFGDQARRWMSEIRGRIGEPLSEREAAQVRLLFDFSLERLSGALSPIQESSPPQLPFPQNIGPLITLLGESDVRLRDRAEDALNRIGPSIKPMLRAAITSANPNQLVRIARLLSAHADLETAPTLIALFPEIPEFSGTRMQILETLGVLARNLSKNPGALTVAEVVAWLAFARREMPTDDADFLGRALVWLAHENPCPELRAALPHLKSRWLIPSPPSFDQARLAIESATKAWKDLPVPAVPEFAPHSLPRPAATSESTLETLPRPTEYLP